MNEHTHILLLHNAGPDRSQLIQFLESEGAEVDVQLVTAWLLYMLWQGKWDTKQRMTLPQADDAKGGLEGQNPRRKLITLWFADKALRGVFGVFARLLGLRHYKLPDMDEIATISHQHYDVHLRGGEGHMEIGKLIQSVTKKKAHMVVSVKPFGCMPSSGVSDGVQSLITAKYPEAIFSAIETTGDGAANVKSRIQMDLFKAKQVAQAEFEAAKATSRGNLDKHNHALAYPQRHDFAGTAARLVAQG